MVPVFIRKNNRSMRRLPCVFKNKKVTGFEPEWDRRVPEHAALTSHTARSLAVPFFMMFG
jgi:hypothetical protein